MEPTPEAIAEAKQNPGGWVYAIDGHYDPNGAVPTEAIKGAWKVDVNGDIVGEFIPNPNYVPDHPKRENWQFGIEHSPLTEVQKQDLRSCLAEVEADRHDGSTRDEV